jgi:hypothetical protein
MTGHGFAASVYLALVALTFAMCAHVPGEVFLGSKGLVTSGEET